MIYFIPFLISITIGVLLTRLILLKNPPAPALLLFLGGTLGIGVSGFLVTSSLFLLGKLAAPYVWTAHLLILAGLTAAFMRACPAGTRFPLKELKRSDIAGLLVLALLILPVIAHALLYPQGGWDAWSCWNLKARFIFLGGPDWKNMFDPLLWRSNIAYPFLLPAFNAWGWSAGTAPAWPVTLASSCFITFLTASTLLFSIKKLAGRLHALLAPVWLLSIFFIVKLASSQYSDLLVGLYLMTAVTAFLFFQKNQDRGWLVIAALALGFLSFTKSEGLVLALITSTAILFWRLFIVPDKEHLKADLGLFCFTLGLAFIPTFIFQLFYSPDSHTFINGFTSAAKPAGLQRLQAIFVFMGIEFLSPKWNGSWLIALAGLVLSGKKCLRRNLLIIPAILISYLLIIIGVYWMNTFFEIIWWLGTTLNRLLYALIPTLILWIFLAFENEQDQ